MIWTVAFWKGAGERALKTFVQTFIPVFVATLGVGSAGVLNAWTAPWLVALQTAAGLALGAAVLSFCTSLGNAQFTAGTPTFELDDTPAPEPPVSDSPDVYDPNLEAGELPDPAQAE